MSADFTGVHVLLHQPPPRRGVYHIGGSGVVMEEAIVRTLGESAERYAQLVSEVRAPERIEMATIRQIAARGGRVLRSDQLRFFSPVQYARAGFLFEQFSEDAPLGWVSVPSLVSDDSLWVPAQLLLVGYTIKRQQGEPWLYSAVTTGTAAHSTFASALRNALLELIQVDSAMGHWHSPAVAQRIELDKRTQALERLIANQFERGQPLPQFYFLPNADLPGFTVACILRSNANTLPAVAIGLGCDLKLVEAMYKGLLESVGVMQLANWNLVESSRQAGGGMVSGIDSENIYDLDRNVVFYSLHENSAPLLAKFDEQHALRASELAADLNGNVDADNHFLVQSFADSGKELIALDLTTPDCRQLGVVVVRAWSPDTLGLAIPSAPPANHPRFSAYGGFQHDRPHPYP